MADILMGNCPLFYIIKPRLSRESEHTKAKKYAGLYEYTSEYMRRMGNRASYYLAIYERIIHAGMINYRDRMEPIII